MLLQAVDHSLLFSEPTGGVSVIPLTVPERKQNVRVGVLFIVANFATRVTIKRTLGNFVTVRAICDPPLVWVANVAEVWLPEIAGTRGARRGRCRRSLWGPRAPRMLSFWDGGYSPWQSGASHGRR